MSIDLALDDAQQAIAGTVDQLCRDRFGDDAARAQAGSFPAEPWAWLAELGVLALATPEGDGGGAEIVAVCEALGRAVFPGPIAHTFCATQLFDGDDRRAIAEGRAVVSVGRPPLMPWAPAATLFVVVDGERAYAASPSGAIEPVETLGGEPWGRVELERTAELGGVGRALALYDIALASYLAAVGRRLVDDTSEHARTRRQFGRPIGDFQAVAHPLADCAMRLGAAETLARKAAVEFDACGADTAAVRAAAGAARISAVGASVESAHVCHQLFGAVGITLEGPVFHISRRIRQLASQEPDDRGSRSAVLARLCPQDAVVRPAAPRSPA